MTDDKDLVFLAETVARTVHRGQLDKAQEPYFEHLARVASAMPSAPARQVAFLHDSLEKGADMSAERLRHLGFSPKVVVAVVALTRRDNEPEEALLKRALADPLARLVKRADLEDNLRQVLAAGGDPDRYIRALALFDRLGATFPAKDGVIASAGRR